MIHHPSPTVTGAGHRIDAGPAAAIKVAAPRADEDTSRRARRSAWIPTIGGSGPHSPQPWRQAPGWPVAPARRPNPHRLPPPSRRRPLNPAVPAPTPPRRRRPEPRTGPPCKPETAWPRRRPPTRRW
ncbi:MAG: hypothetical protein FGM52_08770 [Mycobacterium sp.]|nr:hypothetical protein [Mycobacterium sp.]